MTTSSAGERNTTRVRFGETELSVLDIPAGGTPLRKICRTATPSVELVIPVDATIVVRGENREDLALRPDQAVYLVGARRYAVYSSRRCTALAVAMPTAALEEYTGSAGSLGTIQESAVLAPTKKFLLGTLENTHSLERLSAYFLEKLVLEMVASLLLESRGAGSMAAPSAGLLDRAMSQIAGYRTDRELTPARLAHDLNISMRQLQRLFSAIGSTPSREIRRQRADLAVSMLTNPAFRVLNVSQVAQHSGFADASELRRAFESMGYSTPSEIRHAIESPSRVLGAH